MGIVIPFERRQEPVLSKKKRSSESILRDYARTIIAFRSIFIEDERFANAFFWPRDVIQVIDMDLGLTDSQEQRLARNIKAIHEGAWSCSKLEAIRDVWRLYEDDAPPPSEDAIIAAFILAGAHNERGIEKLVENAKRESAANINGHQSDETE